MAKRSKALIAIVKRVVPVKTRAKKSRGKVGKRSGQYPR